MPNVYMLNILSSDYLLTSFLALGYIEKYVFI